MAIGAWDISTDIMGIPYHTAITILGVHMHNIISKSANNSWSAVTGRIRAQARHAYNRDLALDQRILYVHNFLLARAWYIAQIFPPPEECVRQIHSAISWYIWRGEIFKADLHIACRAHAVPMPSPRPCRSLVHTCHAAPQPCSDRAVSFVKVRMIAGNIRTASPAV
jgi:hypothetical protein